MSNKYDHRNGESDSPSGYHGRHNGGPDLESHVTGMGRRKFHA